MLRNMTVRHIPVKHLPPEYAYPVVEGVRREAHNRSMKNLARIRKAKGLTQTQLAEAANCNQATISKIEKGGNYTLELAGRIASALNVPPVELFGVSELESRYLSAMRAASPERQRAVLLLLEGEDEPLEG